MSQTEVVSRCGYVAIVGRPNVGKSTLLNHLLGQKVSITSRKPQTTRHRVLGIKTENNIQRIFVDTPGIHQDEPKAINRYMNRAATSSMVDVEVILFVVDGLTWTEGDEFVLAQLKSRKAPVVLVINKIDRLDEKSQLLPHIEKLSAMHDFAEIIPVSALKNQKLDELEEQVNSRLPEGTHLFPDDQVTDRTQRFMAAEMVREKIMRQLGQEVPYGMAVEIEEYTRQGRVWHISALILVERKGQKAIVIGQGGNRLRSIGSEARKDMEQMVGGKVMLKLWVKVKGGWADDERALRSLGYNNDA